MDFQRLFLFLIFSFSALLLWDGWQKYQHPASSPLVATAVQENNQQVIVPSQLAKPAEIEKTADIINSGLGKKISVHTDNLLVEINTIGGDIQRVELLKHKDAVDKNKNLVLLQKQDNQNYVAQTGLIGDGLPTHRTLFEATADQYMLADGADTLTVRLVANQNVSKVLTFHRDSYVIDVSYEIVNASLIPLNASAYFQLVRNEVSSSGESKLVPTYTGAPIYTDKEKFQKVEFSSIEKNKTSYPKNTDNGWVGMLQ